MALIRSIAACAEGPSVAPTNTVPSSSMEICAPRVTTIKVPVDKIGEVIGPKGKVINAITEETGAQISIEDDGTVFVGATDGPSAQAA
ncbi:KH domain-containing protein, partial [Mycobacterium scrofulaceum]|uniref:KH domain-containing protein n=1 Tax=Mycobacterium scrofulaceum TaxID=1783 RepID=UPI003B017967